MLLAPLLPTPANEFFLPIIVVIITIAITALIIIITIIMSHERTCVVVSSTVECIYVGVYRYT